MIAETLQQELRQTGAKLCRWRAEWWGAVWGAGLLAALWVLGLLDIFLQYHKAGRMVSAGILFAALLAGIWWVRRILARQPNVVAVAARIESKFPELDNRLINCVQFAAHRHGNPLEAAYLKQGVPQWGRLDLQKLRDQKRYWIAYGALALACVLMMLPALWSGPAWINALCRVLNPFSSRPPSTLAVILDVQPGNGIALRGNPLVLTARVKGKPRQTIWLDLWPSDDKKSTVKLGALQGGAVETFPYTIPKMAANLKYRFRAGDARSDQFAVTVVAPLALTKLTVTITPPKYTGLEQRTMNGLTDEVTIPQGSEVKLDVQCSRPLSSATVTVPGRDAEPMKRSGSGDAWQATVPVFVAEPIRFAAVDSRGEKLASELKFQLQADRPPMIRVVTPAGRVMLTPGAAPRIQWEVSDDFGLTKVWLEQVPQDGDKSAAGKVIQEWPGDGQRLFSTVWNGPPASATTGKPLAYRIVALDNATFGGAQRTISPLVVFDTPGAQQIAEENNKAATETAATLEKMVVLQRANLQQTTQLTAALGASTADQWNGLGEVQQTIRRMAGRLLADPFKPLGGLQPLVRKLYDTAMTEVVGVLDRVPKAEPARKSDLATQSLALETQILRILAGSHAAIGRVDQHRQVTGLLALLEALVNGQDSLLGTTRSLPAKAGPVDRTLVNRQDKLASDVSEFTQVCRKESQSLEHSDPEFSRLVVQVADQCQARQVSADMLRASEQLDNNRPADAVPLQTRALAALKEFQDLLNQWRVHDAQQNIAELAAAMQQAHEKWNKLVKLQTKVVDTIRNTQKQKDQADGSKEETDDELAELKKNIKDAALQVANDLHIMPELPIGNELVADINQVFEDVAQVPGSEKAPAIETGLQKEDFILDGMEKVQKRIDDMEMWLPAKPDNVKRLTENFDQQEMPKMPVTPMPKELDDIIGDLLKQEKDIADKSDDSATDQSAPDMAAGWQVAEGEWTSYGAKGKSGNNVPDHNEQAGRSLVGRQGQANGEAVTSGTINKGDDKIEARRTQDPFQAGKVKTDGETEAKATGGGKQSGVTDQFGMPGAGPRRESDQPGSELGMQAMLRRSAEELYAKASLMHIRTGSLDEAVRYMREAEDTLRNGGPIQQIRELQRRAAGALKKAHADFGPQYAAEPLAIQSTGPSLSDQVAGGAEEAPANYRDQVAEYFKSLSQAP